MPTSPSFKRDWRTGQVLTSGTVGVRKVPLLLPRAIPCTSSSFCFPFVQCLISQQELAAFHGLPVVDTGKKVVDETISDIVALARNTEGESKQTFKVETPLTRHFDNHVLVVLKPTIYSYR